jgi:hypothetical protein
MSFVDCVVCLAARVDSPVAEDVSFTGFVCDIAHNIAVSATMGDTFGD